MNYKKAKQSLEHPIEGTIKIAFGKIPFKVKYKDGHVFENYDPFKFYDIRSAPQKDFVYFFKGKKILIKHAERGEAEEIFVHNS
ncbi:hypothetical protein [Thermoplasma volcanium]|uniref:hypothetical protein n=1 Tax=Thermoplasma volcanium TaxID=50339 RepID=UPI0012EAECB1|nr:hypothetical protein [Thermoplasma volcanium]